MCGEQISFKLIDLPNTTGLPNMGALPNGAEGFMLETVAGDCNFRSQMSSFM